MVPVPTNGSSSTLEAQKASVGYELSKFPQPPKFDDFAKEREYKLERLALAFRIFGKLGFDDGVAGHLTLRDPENPELFWVNAFAVPFSLMTVNDILQIDHHGNIVGGGRPDNQLYNRAAFAIHAQLHMARPDVNAACHSHSIYGKAYSTLGKELQITTQDHCAFYNDVALYPNFGGVVVAEEEGAHIAQYLGNKKAAILQNHGILTVGKTIEEAVAWFIQLEKACQTNLIAMAAGTPVSVPDDEAEFTRQTVGQSFSGWFWAQPYFKVAEKEAKGEHKREF